MHWALAPAGLLLSPAAAEPEAALRLFVFAATGFGAGVTVVRAGDDELVVRQAARTLLYHLPQFVVVAVVFVVVFTAPGDLPAGVSAAAVLHAALFAFPAFVQS